MKNAFSIPIAIAVAIAAVSTQAQDGPFDLGPLIVSGGLMPVKADAYGRASYTYLNAENPDGSVEIRRPEHELALGSTLRIYDDRASFSTDLRHVTGNADIQFFGELVTEELPDIATVDFSPCYAIDDSVTVTGLVVNLFNEDTIEV
ncbi:MAG: hypothetical protein OXF73_11615 [Gammaproteobacteria bacterium]|nr:hypothetical protein [Gammaproteobacteria bacterium]